MFCYVKPGLRSRNKKLPSPIGEGSVAFVLVGEALHDILNFYNRYLAKV